MNRQKWILLIAGGVLCLWAILGSGIPARADDTSCDGWIGSDTVDGLVVPQGDTCILAGTSVQGNIFVEEWGTLLATGVSVDGNIQARGAFRVEVGGDSSVGGSIQVFRSRQADIQAVEINGNLQLNDNWSSLSASDNRINGDLQAFDNRGGLWIAGNTIGGNLQCRSNDPPPEGRDNVVGGNMEDQCEGFGDEPPPAPTNTPTPLVEPPSPPTPTPTLEIAPTTAPTNPPPTPTQQPPTKTPRPTQDTGTLAAQDDQYTFIGDQLRIADPGLLANDSYPDGDSPRLVLVTQPKQGSVDIDQDGSFVYRVGYGPFQEDSFEYLLRGADGESNTAVVRLVMDDVQPPAVQWTGPIGDGERYDVEDGDRIVLEVAVEDDGVVEAVEFLRWDAVQEQYINLGTLEEAPYRVEVNAGSLNSGWNQIFVVAVDLAGNSPEQVPYIWLYKRVSLSHQIYLPMARK